MYDYILINNINYEYTYAGKYYKSVCISIQNKYAQYPHIYYVKKYILDEINRLTALQYLTAFDFHSMGKKKNQPFKTIFVCVQQKKETHRWKKVMP